MNTRTQDRDSWIRQLGVRLVFLSLLFAAMTGCAPAATQFVDQATPTPLIEATQPVDPTAPPPPVEVTLPSGWEAYTSQGQCGYRISHPANMDGTGEGTDSWSLSIKATEPVGLVTNFIYISVIPDGFQGGAGVIYNYDPAATEALLGMQIGESKSIHPDPNMVPGFTFTRLPDTTLSNQVAKTYENTQPWEAPSGTKEIRYYLQANGCTYMIGGYMDTVGSGQTVAINEELFDEIIATFELN